MAVPAIAQKRQATANVDHPPPVARAVSWAAVILAALAADPRRRSCLIPWGSRDRTRSRRSRARARTYVLDTQCCSPIPALVRFDEHEVVLPIVV
jgi:hypothetical protein